MLTDARGTGASRQRAGGIAVGLKPTAIGARLHFPSGVLTTSPTTVGT